MRTSRTALLVLVPGGLLLGGLVASGEEAGRIEAPDLYGRSVERYIERAQEELLRTTELWQDHSTWETAWRVRTEHYEVRTTESRAFGLEVAQGMEMMLGHFQRLLGTDYAPDEPFSILVFPTLAAYNDYGNQFGAEHSSFYGSFFAETDPELAVAVLYDPNPVQVKMWITHSALHQFLAHAYTRQQPLWVSEGLASYFALFWDFQYGVRELGRIAGDDDEFVPLGQLLVGQIAAYTDRTHNRFIELGMLFAYLLAYREDTRTVDEGNAPFGEYLRALIGGGDTSGSDVRALLTERTDELEAEFRAFDFGGG